MGELEKIKKEVLKNLIKRLHQGENPAVIKKEFKELIKDATPAEIGLVEEELIKEGMPREEVRRLCDIHLEIFKESLDREKPIAPPGHPVFILMEEHNQLIGFSLQLRQLCASTSQSKADFAEIEKLVDNFKNSSTHYLREENVLFPYLEKHGITEPPKIMWMEHDMIRDVEKRIYENLSSKSQIGEGEFFAKMEKLSTQLNETLKSHFYKENNILFPMSMQTLNENEWKEIREQFDAIGYCPFSPEVGKAIREEEIIPVSEPSIPGAIGFETGSLTKDELEAILNTLPVDITFVDKDDKVRYFSQSKERIFVRTKAVIGRTVQQCHPQKSLHMVTRILDDFKSGNRDNAEFWITLNNRLIYIRYFAVRDKNGKYLGCLEVTQDITEIKNITGEKRLL